MRRRVSGAVRRTPPVTLESTVLEADLMKESVDDGVRSRRPVWHHSDMRVHRPEVALLLLVSLLLGCTSGSSGESSASASSTTGAGGAGGGGDGGAGGGVSTDATTVPVTIASYPDGAGDLMIVSISVNGSAPFGVLVDTGSDGLRVFESAIEGATVEATSKSLSVEFGYGNRMLGHLAHAEVAFGEVSTPGPIAIHLVEAFECAPDVPTCDFAKGDASVLTKAGVFGILGTSLRRGFDADIYSPFAQLDATRSRGFIVRSGGFGSTKGELDFALEPAEVASFKTVALAPMGSHPNGRAAWRDDAVETCFHVDDVPVEPACTETVFDTGASVDVIYAPKLPSSALADGVLAPGVSLRVIAEPGLDMTFTVGATPTPSVDLVFVDDTIPFALLGMGVFYRNDVLFDSSSGAIGFRLR